jgi:predicted Na+-dependent transporter
VDGRISAALAIRGVLLISMSLLVFALGLRSAEGDELYLLRRPRLLVRSILAMNVILPAGVLVLVRSLGIPPPVRLALVALALAPVPPLLPYQHQQHARASSYAYGILVASALCAIVLVPLSAGLLGLYLAEGRHVGIRTVAATVAATVLLPLGAGILARRGWPARAERTAAILNRIGAILLIAALAFIGLKYHAQVLSLIGNGTLAVIVLVNVLALALGHWLGGPDPINRTVLALATATRHPGIAIAIASAAFPAQTLAAPAVLLAILVNAACAASYAKWRKSFRGAAAADPPDSQRGTR